MSVHALLDLFEELFGVPPAGADKPEKPARETADTVTFPRSPGLRPAGAK